MFGAPPRSPSGGIIPPDPPSFPLPSSPRPSPAVLQTIPSTAPRASPFLLPRPPQKTAPERPPVLSAEAPGSAAARFPRTHTLRVRNPHNVAFNAASEPRLFYDRRPGSSPRPGPPNAERLPSGLHPHSPFTPRTIIPVPPVLPKQRTLRGRNRGARGELFPPHAFSAFPAFFHLAFSGQGD